MLKLTSSGLNILITEDLPSSTPIKRIMNDTIKADIYSSLPWPKGCSLSTGLLASLAPAIVTTFEPASDKLLNASAVIDTEPDTVPIMNLTMHRKALQIIPHQPLIVPTFSRPREVETSYLLFIIFIRNFVIKNHPTITVYFYIIINNKSMQ